MRRFILGLVLFVGIITSSFACQPKDAFVIKVLPLNQQTIIVKLGVGVDKYIYADKLIITNLPDSKVKLGSVLLPKPQVLEHPTLGKLNVYDKDLIIPVPITDFADGKLAIKVAYQGGKLLEIYPEQVFKQNLDLNIAANSSNNSIQSKLRDLVNSSNSIYQIKQLFEGDSTTIIGVFFVLGLLIAFTPCFFPMLPVLILVISGKHLSTRRSFILALSYILGGAVIYALLGVIAAKLGFAINVYFQNPWVMAGVSLLFIIFALAMLDAFNLQLPTGLQNKLINITNKKHNGSVLGAFIIGGIANLILSPCVTAPLAGALVYVTTTGDQWLGASALFALGVGAGIPLLTITVFGKKILPKSGPWLAFFKKLLAILLLAMPLYLFSGTIDAMIFNGLAVLWLISVVLIIVFSFSGLSLWFKMIIAGLMSVLIGGIFALGILLSSNADKVARPNFNFVTTAAELKAVLDKTKDSGKPVFIDYWAAWCGGCQKMDKETFSDSRVIQLLNDNFIIIRADVTLAGSDSQTLFKRYKVISQPTFVFLDSKHQLLTDQGLAGAVSASTLSEHLQKIIK